MCVSQSFKRCQQGRQPRLRLAKGLLPERQGPGRFESEYALLLATSLFKVENCIVCVLVLVRIFSVFFVTLRSCKNVGQLFF